MEKIDVIINAMAEQRNAALDQLVAYKAETVILQSRVKELEEEVAKLKEPKEASE